MRKKLLALVMCATMVLGTAVTASAAVPSKDTFKAAKAVFSAGSKFDAEYEGKKIVKFTTSDNTDGKISVWGLRAFNNEFAAVKLGKDGDLKDKALVWVGTEATGTFVRNNGYFVNRENQPVAVLTQLGICYLVKERSTTDATKADLVKTTNSTKVDDAYVSKMKVNPSVTASAATAAIISAGGTDYVGYEIGNAKYLVNSNGVRVASVVVGEIVYDKTPVLYTAADLQVAEDGVYQLAADKYVYIENAGTTAAKSYDVDKDGYIQKKDATATENLVKADASSVTRSDADAQYYVVLKELKDTNDRRYAGFQRTVAYALDEKKLSKDAVAVRVALYELVSTDEKAVDSDDAIKYLKRVNSVSTTTSITLNSDVLSRTGLKTASGLSVYTIDVDDTEKKDGSDVAKLESLGTTTVDATFTFDVKDYTNNVIIFDGYAAESTDNAGQADADKTTDSTTSPKTGDVAPIAALAVVMMGTFGAMVVASKKRA